MPAATDRSIPTEVVTYLDLHHIITLATGSFTGMPHANTVAYASDNQRIFFSVSDTAQIVRNVNDNHYVSFTIDDYTTDWRKVRELQGVGSCQAATPEDELACQTSFAAKFGDGASIGPGLLFVLRPFEMHFVDYSYELELSLASPAITHTRFEVDDVASLPNEGAVSTSLNRTSFKAGEVIFKPGRKAGRYFIVVEGEVELRGEGHGADQTVTRVGPGQLFGDQAALSGHRGVLTAHAVTDCVLLAVDRDAMRDLMLPRHEGVG